MCVCRAQVHAVDLVRTVLMLLRERSREVAKSVIGFVKVALSSLPNDILVSEPERDFAAPCRAALWRTKTDG